MNHEPDIEGTEPVEEPLEELLGMTFWIGMTTKRMDDTWIATIGEHDDTERRTIGYGQTIDAAIRDAVRIATRDAEDRARWEWE